jgi:CxC2 like cysteine cluster associated with KDZ transposases
MHQSFVVVHINGVHLINLDFCACSDSPLPREQLLEVGWWPSTPLEPQSAASMAVLRSFHAWNLQGQISPTDFYRGLEQLTCGDGLSSVPVSIYGQKHHGNADDFQGSPAPVDVDGARVASHKNDKTGWAWP